MNKRTFLKQLGKAAALTPFLGYDSLAYGQELEGYELPDNEDFWARIRKDYALKPDYINLENGYYCIAPRPILSKFLKHVEEVNYQGSYYMRTVQWDNKKNVASRMASFVGCEPEELIITRNTTESLDLIISGLSWEKGDEAVFAIQDYGAMRDQFELIANRYGVINKIVSVPNHPASDDELVTLYEQQITPKTKLLMVCHMINITGQILPVRKICDMAHRHDVKVLVDGAHCVGHFEVNIAELNCDFYGSSLHKWLSSPLGSGILYVNSKNIPEVWPLLAEEKREAGDISRLNHTGTHPVHTDLAINDALDYQQMIGTQRKEERLRYLQRYWSSRLRDVPKIRVNTPKEAHRSCGIANVGVEGIKPAQLAEILLEEFKIFTVAIDHANVQGCRITPNIYTTTGELDKFVAAMKTTAGRA